MHEILLKIIDSDNFSTGGGSAAAVAGAMAAGLVAMVAKLSTNKDYGFPKEKYIEIASELDNIAKELLAGSNKDTLAFSKIKEAYSLPKTTETEKKARKKAIQEAAVGASNVPKNNALLCKKVYKYASLLEGNSNPSASSDLIEARILANAGIMGGVLNIEANLPLIKDEQIKGILQNEADELKEFYERHK